MTSAGFYTVILAAPDADGSELTEWVLKILLNIAVIILAGKLVANIARDDWGKIIAIICGAIIAFGVITFPVQTGQFLAEIWQTAAEITA